MTYSRVSTLAQESVGQSLPNQERTFALWVERTGATRVKAYREAASAGTVEGRAEFQRMIEELPRTKPDAVVIDTLDRFTRNLREGLELLEHLRGHHVGLLPIDWRREKPIDVDDDRDWSDVVEEFTAAERERRKLRRRILRAYEGRRERGATTTNRPGFGLLKQGDRIVPDPERAWILAEVERRALEREAYGKLSAWAHGIDPTAWKTRAGVGQFLANRAYLEAGARTEARQAELDALVHDHASQFGGKKAHHELAYSGVFVCGLCLDAGYPPERSVMMSAVAKGRERVICEHRQNVDPRGHSFYCDSRWLEPKWFAYVEKVAAMALAFDRYGATEQASPDRRRLERRLAEIDQEVAALAARRDRALDLLGDKDPGVVRQVRSALQSVDADEVGLVASREAVLGELAHLERPRRDAARLQAAVAGFQSLYGRASPRDRNKMARALIDAVGSRPELRREGKGGRGQRYDVVVRWPAVDASIAMSRSSSSEAPSASRSSRKRAVRGG